MKKDIADKSLKRGEFIRNALGGVVVSAIKANAELVLHSVSKIEIVRAYYEALRADTEKLTFKRLKSKELLAFLIDRNGAGMTAKQICAALFPEDTDDSKNASYLRQLVLDLKNTLRTVGAEHVLCHETPCYRVDK